MVRTKALGVAAAAACFLASACAQEEESLIVLHAPAWQTPGDCTVDAGNDTTLGRGTLDVSFGTAYTMPVILLNNLVGRSPADSNSGTDTAEMQLRDVDVELSMPQAEQIIDRISDIDGSYVDFTQVLPGNSIAAGERHAQAVDIVPSKTSQALRDQIASEFPGGDTSLTLVATTRFHALRSGNTSGNVGVIDAREFTFPLTVCSGCLRRCLSCPNAECPVGVTDADFVGGICGNAQDFDMEPGICAAGN